MSRFKSAVLASSLLFAFSDAALAAQRVFVSSSGNDANSCSLLAPCRSFQAAHVNVDDGGEIVALDAAGYGAITITKSVTITANPGFYAGIAASSGAAVTIATPGVNVILRGLNLNGVGATVGVLASDGASLSIENCVITNFISFGVNVANVARVRIADSLFRGNDFGAQFGNGVRADVTGSKFLNNGTIGVFLSAGTTASFASVSDSVASGATFGFGVGGSVGSMSVMRSTASNNASVGVHAQSGGSVVVGYTVATGNNIGFNAGGALFESMGNNLVRMNAINSQGTVTPISGT